MVPDFEDELDVVVGSGSSGCAAALASHDHGFRTSLLEKGAVAGGSTTFSNGGWILANHLDREAGNADSKEEGAEYLRFLGADYQVEENLRNFIENDPLALEYFAGLG